MTKFKTSATKMELSFARSHSSREVVFDGLYEPQQAHLRVLRLHAWPRGQIEELVAIYRPQPPGSGAASRVDASEPPGCVPTSSLGT